MSCPDTWPIKATCIFVTCSEPSGSAIDQGWQAAVRFNWCDGYYDSQESAVEAARQFSDQRLRSLRHIWSPDGENRPATMADLDELSRSLPAPCWYWRLVGSGKWFCGSTVSYRSGPIHGALGDSEYLPRKPALGQHRAWLCH